MSMKHWVKRGAAWLGAMASLSVTLGACAPGYMKASELESRDQGPTACSKSCQDIGMRMVAMVLVGDTLPGCVCQVLEKQQPDPKLEAAPTTEPPAAAPPASDPPSAPSSGDGVKEGASASTAGYVVIAAAAAARQQQAAQEQQRQQQQK